MKYIDADKLIAEIKRLHKEHSGKYGCDEVGLNLEYLEDFIDSLQQEQPEQDLTEFEKALDNFGEAYATLVDRDNNPNQGIRINAYHELVRENINEILYLAKEYVKQEQPKKSKKDCNGCPHCVDRKDQYGWRFKGCFGGPYKGTFIAEIDECPLKQEQPEVDLEKAATHVYESWMGGTMDDVRRDMVKLGKVLNARKEE